MIDEVGDVHGSAGSVTGRSEQGQLIMLLVEMLDDPWLGLEVLGAAVGVWADGAGATTVGGREGGITARAVEEVLVLLKVVGMVLTREVSSSENG
jgi:hypothetical protein